MSDLHSKSSHILEMPVKLVNASYEGNCLLFPEPIKFPEPINFPELSPLQIPPRTFLHHVYKDSFIILPQQPSWAGGDQDFHSFTLSSSCTSDSDNAADNACFGPEPSQLTAGAGQGLPLQQHRRRGKRTSLVSGKARCLLCLRGVARSCFQLKTFSCGPSTA